MSYTKSRARVLFEQKVDELLVLARANKKLTGLTYDQKNKVYQSCVIFLCSAIEDYQKSIIEDCFYQMIQQHVQIANIHVNTRAYVLIKKLVGNFRNYLFDKKNEKTTISNISNNTEMIRKLTTNEDTFDMTWLHKEIWGDKKYPSIKNLAILYNRLGIANIFASLNSKGQKDYKTKLESLTSIRESAAHSSGVAVTYNDVKENCAFVKNFIYMLDKELYSHFSHLAGVTVWPV